MILRRKRNLQAEPIRLEKRAEPAQGPLQVHPSNPRYFSDGSGKAVYLTGSHTWANLQDFGRSDPPPIFDYTAYLDFMQQHNHNFMRVWIWEHAKWAPWTHDDYWIHPFPYRRTGPGTALDGKPKFDLTQFDQSFFNRLRSRVIAARDRGIYVAVMLFQGGSVGKKENGADSWKTHPYHPANNINGIDGNANGDGHGEKTHTLQIPTITTLQEKYVRKVIDTLNDPDNVLWEISNESHSGSRDWQYRMIRFIKKYEAGKPKQHPVGMTNYGTGAPDDDLFASPADWISPGFADGYRDNPPAADGGKIIIADTDHLWGIGGDRQWVWKSFMRGLNPIYMDPFNYTEFQPASEVRLAMGHTMFYAQKMNLAAMTPRGDLASSGYCLANPEMDGAEYLVYLPSDRKVVVDLSASPGELSVEWLSPATGAIMNGGMTIGGKRRSFIAPFCGDAVLYVQGKTDGTI
jgi:hypothetical protein